MQLNWVVVLIIDLILSDEYLIKDNHIASSDLKFLVQKAIKNKKGKKITVEVDNLKQLKLILGFKIQYNSF